MRRLVAWLARLVSFGLFSRVEVVGREHLPRRRATVLVANHFNGFVDPVVLARVLGRLPRFVAKAALTKVFGVGPLLKSVGVVFVERRQDDHKGDAATTNVSAFAACHAALRRNDVIAIFPEGTTHDRPHLDPLRTGAARIALGADPGEPPLIVPVGLTYTDKYAIRSSVLVEFGEPIDPRVVAPAAIGEDDHIAVRQLTDAIDVGLRAVSPDFADIEEWLACDTAATIAARNVDGRTPSLAQTARLSRAIAQAPPAKQALVRTALGRYATMLSPLRLTDADVADPTRSTAVLRSALIAGFWVALAGALVVATILVNAIPFALITLASVRTKTPVTKGTVRVLVGLVTFPIAWTIGAVLGAEDVPAGVLLFVVFALGAAAVIVLVDRAVALGRAVVTWYVVRERAAAIDLARVVRADVIDAVFDLVPITSVDSRHDRRWSDRPHRRESRNERAQHREQDREQPPATERRATEAPTPNPAPAPSPAPATEAPAP